MKITKKGIAGCAVVLALSAAPFTAFAASPHHAHKDGSSYSHHQSYCDGTGDYCDIEGCEYHTDSNCGYESSRGMRSGHGSGRCHSAR
ncbi:hypothetical protein [Clostridium sp. AM58-1XD]|uniref:hypothetical protein n=1 Tax=Clostridium sp. AM58-1XD TaxID=2292307 RepID=UPI000E522412|nr:hypothetical protein [Clostridium sp. AM58-1XD]RGY97954.1 hypothetical protein DXA13_12920 [Clostridium sp. AM58-1XD]